jgi:hypothetical protein
MNNNKPGRVIQSAGNHKALEEIILWQYYNFKLILWNSQINTLRNAKTAILKEQEKNKPLL